MLSRLGRKPFAYGDAGTRGSFDVVEKGCHRLQNGTEAFKFDPLPMQNIFELCQFGNFMSNTQIFYWGGGQIFNDYRLV